MLFFSFCSLFKFQRQRTFPLRRILLRGRIRHGGLTPVLAGWGRRGRQRTHPDQVSRYYSAQPSSSSSFLKHAKPLQTGGISVWSEVCFFEGIDLAVELPGTSPKQVSTMKLCWIIYSYFFPALNVLNIIKFKLLIKKIRHQIVEACIIILNFYKLKDQIE